VSGKNHISTSVAKTHTIAGDLARSLAPGDCVALDGELGSGKTQFVRGLVGALGGDPSAVCSPTFVLLNIYKTPSLCVFHLDAYRVSGPDELAAIGFDELLTQKGLVVVEWAARVADLLPPRRWQARFYHQGDKRRRIEIEPPVKTGSTISGK
jgi:tRNA threonylcarbamoyl adenosine modification protein YjeE